MKTLLSFVSASLLAVSFSFAQVPGIPGLSRAPVATGPQGTTLGANLTSGAGGIDLANRVKLRGYVDFMYANQDVHGGPTTLWGGSNPDDKGFSTAVDMDFLLDFSPVTAEIHTNLHKNNSGGGDGAGLEQAFIRYSFNRDFSISMGRQLTTLGFEADEQPNLYQVSNAYLVTDVAAARDEVKNYIKAWGGTDFAGLRRNYVDGVRANFNNGRFGATLGIHNHLYTFDGNTDNGDVGVDLQLALMIMPGFEARLGFAHDSEAPGDNDIEQFNAWLSYADRGLTLAFEYDDWDIMGQDLWDIMLMGNYQFNDLFSLTLRYSHEDADGLFDDDRITLGAGFSITDNFGINIEYSHSEVDVEGDSNFDVDEFYTEGIMTF
jgi:hypothetical protein